MKYAFGCVIISSCVLVEENVQHDTPSLTQSHVSYRLYFSDGTKLPGVANTLEEKIRIQSDLDTLKKQHEPDENTG